MSHFVCNQIKVYKRCNWVCFNWSGFVTILVSRFPLSLTHYAPSPKVLCVHECIYCRINLYRKYIQATKRMDQWYVYILAVVKESIPNTICDDNTRIIDYIYIRQS